MATTSILAPTEPVSGPAMERLDFRLHDFTRWVWTGDSARAVWEPRIARIGAAWRELEILSVAAGMRRCALQNVSPEDLPEFAARIAGAHGLTVLPLHREAASAATYSAGGRPADPGQPFVYRVAIGRTAEAAAFARAWAGNDTAGIGALLGFPGCCIDFFAETWDRQRFLDTTWPMAAASAPEVAGVRTLRISGPPEANILLRWLGVRAVPHLPCRSDCAATAELGRRFLALGREAGYETEMDWMVEMLSWPLRWSALHGIAEIRTPVLKIVATTDATPHVYEVHRQSESYPMEGAAGLHFPYRIPDRPKVTGTVAFREGLVNPIPVRAPRPAWYHLDNGFDSEFSMHLAHAPIRSAVSRILPAAPAAVVDLGCGNGALLQHLCADNPLVTIFGVELDPVRAAHATELEPRFASHFVCGDLFHTGRIWDHAPFALALLMPGRLLETDPASAALLKDRLRRHATQLLVYAYGDWLTRFGGLHGLAAAAGLDLLTEDRSATVSLATVRDLPAKELP